MRACDRGPAQRLGLFSGSLLVSSAIMSPGDESALLHAVLTSRVYDVARETPLDEAPRLSRRLGNEVLLKREDLQPVFSFKLRGAHNKIAHLPAEERAKGVIAASAGNHAQGVAYSARHLGLRAVIVMPKTTPEIKVDAVRSAWGPRWCSRATTTPRPRPTATARGRERAGLHPPVRRPAGDRGPGHDRRGDPAPEPGASCRAVFVPVGGGGLIAGIAGLHQGAACPQVKIDRRGALRGRRDVPVPRGGRSA